MGRNSHNSDVHPYLITRNWLKPEWQFWESPKYTEKAKEYFRDTVSRMINEQKSLTRIEENL